MVLLKEARRHTDGALVEQCRRGDSEAFDELVRRHKQRVYNVVYRFLGSHEDALDLCQEVFVRAYRGISNFSGSSQVSTWLYSIASNISKNRLRDGKRKGRNLGGSLEALAESRGAAAETGPESSPREQAMTQELEQTLQRCLNELPDHFRMAFCLRTFDDMSYEEIAEAMDCPVGTVRSRLNHARRFLRDRLRELSVI